MIRQLLMVALVLGGGWISPSVLAETHEKSEIWLRAMNEAYSTLSFRGNLVFQNAQGLNTLSIVRDLSGNQHRARMVYLDGRYREVVRDGELVTFLNSDQVLRFEHGETVVTPEQMLRRFSALGDSYRSEFVGRDRVAGRAAIMVNVVPGDRHRYGYQLWLDEQTGLLLKSLMLDDKGGVLERLQFVSLQVGSDIRPEELRLSVDVQQLPEQLVTTHRIESRLDLDETDRPLNWQVGWVPAGFSLTQRDERRSPVGKHPVDSLMYSDGLASFSLFVELDDENLLSEATDSNGATTAISRVFRDHEDYYMVTVVGEIPLGTAERIAVSIAPTQR
ncbi:MucB/RseB C-terminal domain-containing protein [Aestuariirhabdus litorea]|uniref:MucB/RseB C-terminal domain-containing protein n=1 Tax=Aestuariirhabdus litorea TaxID=2528527 RepID=UPI0013E2CCFF|nr:MucB/RseB C-terminal domain-containing protein [Aestuariirhabdus litorea]